MVVKFAPGNKFSLRVSLADAAVAWQGLTQPQQEQVQVGADGLPYSPEFPELRERAEGLLIAIHSGRIGGLVHDEDGYYFKPERMQLDRKELAAWIAETDKRLQREGATAAATAEAQPAVLEKLLTKEEVCLALNISKAGLDRMRTKGLFPEFTHTSPNRWRESVVAAHIANKAIDTARTKDSRAATDEEDI